MKVCSALRITVFFVFILGTGCRLSFIPAPGLHDPGSPDLPDVPLSRRTIWNPGVPGGIPDSGAFPVHTTVTLGNDAAANRTAIQTAIDAAGADADSGHPRVVQLPAGIFPVDGTIFLNRSFVVLHGAGPDVSGTGAGTRLVETGVDTDLFLMGGYPDYTEAYDIPGGIAMGAAAFTGGLPLDRPDMRGDRGYRQQRYHCRARKGTTSGCCAAYAFL
jgi:hypothetical protein